AESGSTPIGLSVQRLDGDIWDAPRAETKGADNTPPPAPTLISAIQGSGSESPLLGSAVTVSAVVTGLVNNGFFVQEEAADSDGDASTSEGIFVFTGGAPTVVVGDQVTLSGTVEEFFGETQIGGTTILSQATGGIIPTPTLIELSPLGTDFEAVEGMLVEVTSGVADVNLEVIENFNLDRFGEITISAGRQTQPTQIFDPQDQAAEVAQLAQENLNNRLGIDDGVGGSNPDAFAYLPSNVGDNGNGILDAGDTFTADGQTVRLGAELTNNPIGIMRFNFGEYKLSAQNTLEFDESTNNDARPDTPPVVDGALKVGSFNVLNYFTTLDTSANQDSVGPNNLDPRGAETADQLQRQTDKLVDAILATGASAFALQELENNGFGTDGSPSAIGALVDAINAELISQGQAGTYAFVDPTGGDPAGFIGTDAITTGIIYDTAALSLTKSDVLVFAEASAADTFAIAEVLNPFASSDDQVGDFQRNRPAVAATFEEIASGESFTMVSTHFKSKGDSNLGDVIADAQAALDSGAVPAVDVPAVEQAILDLRADPNFDQGDGQAFWNQVRADASAELAEWLETTYAPGDPDILILGDYNAYSQEDPVTTLRDDEGYRDLLGEFIGVEDAYSFVFDGQQGSLDQAMATESLFDQVKGVAEWHINADEPDLLDYSDGDFFSDDVFAASDHDPVIIGLDLNTDMV
ncbi:MAG: ExeM/NucH family extracellular endonuclease, partial [Pseudomonadota bacterium]